MSLARPCTPSRAATLLLFFVFGSLYYWSHAPFSSIRSGSFQFVPSSYDWSKYEFENPIPENDMTLLPRSEPVKIAQIQHDFSSRSPGSGAQRARLNDVKAAFLKTWRSYEEHAWGHDELKPLSLEDHDPFGGWAATMIDSLVTLWIMGLKKEFYKSVAFVAGLDWGNSTKDDCNLFETNIRHLGGLLSAYELSGEKVLLDKAVELGNMLYAAFDNKQHIPPHTFRFYDLERGRVIPEPRQSSAAIGSFSLEFTKLTQLTGIPKFYDAVDRITRALNKTQGLTRLPGLWPVQIDVINDFDVSNRVFSLGADADSLYEYLAKEYLLLGGTEPVYEKMHRDAMDTALANLVFRPMLPDRDNILMLGTAELNSRKKASFKPRVQHLGCFAGGMFALGGKAFGIDNHVQVGEKLARGCAHAYRVFPTGIMPEIVDVEACPTLKPCKYTAEPVKHYPPGFNPHDRRYFLRPEAIESIFLLYRITGKQDLRDIAWNMWTAIRAATETEAAFASVEDVTKEDTQQLDAMESFWLAETLKYFWLIFEDEDVVSLDEWVFNTEAHPLRRR